MIVKKVTADSVSEAMERIKRELGNDAIILNTRHIKVGGFFGLFAKKKVELVASVDEHVSNEPIVSKQATSRKDIVEIIQPIPVRPTIVTVGERPLPKELRHYAPLLAEPALQQMSERLHERLLTAYYQTQRNGINRSLDGRSEVGIARDAVDFTLCHVNGTNWRRKDYNHR
ncbi:hypothetical protein OVA29_07955 [Exiguobacterium sp. SL14]|nr:hypothetical protein [Exiguobacterium sp. SL14]MCY1690630.1 hypothetical protein [Exiguobacterium sp. SL14]